MVLMHVMYVSINPDQILLAMSLELNNLDPVWPCLGHTRFNVTAVHAAR